MPSPTTGTDRAKVLSIRFTAEEFEALTARATEIGVGPSTLARTFVRHGLSRLADTSATTTTPSARGSAFETHLSALIAAHVKADLESRVAALEKWVSNCEDPPGIHVHPAS